MRTFKKFPEHTTCPVCNTNKDEVCVLIGISGTQEGHNIQAQPFHLKCLDLVWIKHERDTHTSNLVAMKWDGEK